MRIIKKSLFLLPIFFISSSYANSSLPPPDAPFTIVGNKRTTAFYDDMGAKAVEIIYPWSIVYSKERKTAAIEYSISNFRMCVYPPSEGGSAFIYIKSSSYEDYVFIKSGRMKIKLGIKTSISDTHNDEIVHGALLSTEDFNALLQSMQKNPSIYYNSGKITVPLAGPYASEIANYYLDYTNTYIKK